MALQPYEDRALVASIPSQELTAEEYERRIKDVCPTPAVKVYGMATMPGEIVTERGEAEELQAKLTYITEKVPTRIMNTAGSNAGAGSGEFHMYRMARRREMMRLQRIDEQAAAAAETAEFEANRDMLRRGDEARTAKRREKRQKKKRKKPTANQQAGTMLPPAADGSDSEAEEQPALD